jgi:hypothetical protein
MSAAKVLQRDFLYPEEGLASYETVVDSPFDIEDDDYRKFTLEQAVPQGQFSFGAFMVLVSEGNKLMIPIQSKDDLEAIRAIGAAATELAEEADKIFNKLDAETEVSEAVENADNVLEFPVN